MKTNKELDVDIIGGHGPLTKEEQKIISDFIKARKSKKTTSSKRTTKRQQAA